MEPTTQGVTTTAQTADQTNPTAQFGPCPDEHRYTVQFIREAMAEDGMDWRQTAPTKKYAITMALASGREKCGSELGMKLREWVQTAPVLDPDQLDQLPPPPAPEPEPEADPEPEEKRSGLFGLFKRTKETDQAEAQTEPEQTVVAEAEPVVEPEPERAEEPFHTGLSRLRFVPPIASLGLSAIMQVIIVTDLLGHALNERYHLGFWAYGIAALFGAGIACALEGSAAYILDLYKKHLLEQDSTFSLRLLLLVYVSGSAALIHWWTDKRQLPWELALVLSCLAGSSIVLWIMGSKWENRVKMRENGQLDPAMVRLASSAKFWHPLRWIQTLWLTSWEPVQTTAEARERHSSWSADRQAKAADRAAKKEQTKTDQTD